MGSNASRLFIAMSLSLLGIVGTKYWAIKTAPKNSDSDKTPVATLVESTNEVRKKPTDRLVWFAIEPGDFLYAGETVKTSDNADAKIKLSAVDGDLEMDPDSEVVLEVDDGKMNLDFLKGNMVVKTEKPTENLTIKAGEKKIAVNQSTLNLAKSKTGKVDIKVLKGKAEIKIGNKVVESVKPVEIPKIDFVAILPRNQDVLIIQPQISDAINFEWKPIPEHYSVVLEMGPTKQDLKEITKEKQTAGNVAKLTQVVKVGKYFWRLKAVSKDKAYPVLSTGIYSNEFIEVKPPVLELPLADHEITPSVFPVSMNFAWTNPGQFKKLSFEIAKDPLMKDHLVAKRVDNALSRSENIPVEGTYYWRVSGYLANSTEPVSSPIYKFTVGPQKQLETPFLELPLNNFKMTLREYKKQFLKMRWKQVADAETYRMFLQTVDKNGARNPASDSKLAAKFEGRTNEFMVRDLKPGKYIWSVMAASGKGRPSKGSEERIFWIEEDPLLPAPKFTDETPAEIQASSRGNIKVAWKAVKGAKLYIVMLKTPTGELQEQQIELTEVDYKKLQPGEYSITLKSVDVDGNHSPLGETRIIRVPELSDLKAPTLKKVEVK